MLWEARVPVRRWRPPLSTARLPLPCPALTLLALACASLLAARTVNTVLEVLLTPLAVAPRPPPRAPTPAAPSTPLSPEPLARLTGLTLTPPEDPAQDIHYSGLDAALPHARGLRLLGTAVSAREEASFASIYEETARRARTVWPGSQLPGTEVVAIERTRVLLRTAGRLEQLSLAPAATPAAAPAPAPGPAPLGAGIREVGPDAYAVPREELQRALAHPEQLLTEARLIPTFNGLGGFKVVGIRPGSLFARLGLRNGDAVQRVNGLSLLGVESALEALGRLREGSHFQLELLRDGQPVKKDYSVQD